MNKYILNLDDFKNLEFTQMLGSHSGSGNSKRLMASVKGGITFYEVYDHGKLVLESALIKNAVDKYNSL